MNISQYHLSGSDSEDLPDEQLEAEMAEYDRFLAQNRDSGSELSDLDSDQFDIMEGGNRWSQVRGWQRGDKGDSKVLQGADSKIVISPHTATRSGRKYGNRGSK
jgi:hypothetical protein